MSKVHRSWFIGGILISTIIQANIFLYEPIFALQIAGTALILIGVLTISRKK